MVRATLHLVATEPPPRGGPGVLQDRVRDVARSPEESSFGPFFSLVSTRDRAFLKA